MIDDDLALGAKRFRALLRQLKSEHGSGWQTEYAKRMGFKQPHLSDMLAGKNVTLLSIEKAVRSMGIAREFFFDRSLGDSPNYRDFVGKRFASASIRATASATATTRYEPEPRDEEGCLFGIGSYSQTQPGAHQAKPLRTTKTTSTK